LTFHPTPSRVPLGQTETTSFTITASDGISAPVKDAKASLITTAVKHVPTFSGIKEKLPAQSVTNEIHPFSAVTIETTDKGLKFMHVALKITPAASVTFKVPSGFTGDEKEGVLNWIGNPADATGALQKLIFPAKRQGDITFTITLDPEDESLKTAEQKETITIGQ
jgi:hypothetical protein